MDTVNGVPALAFDDPMSTVAAYSRDLREALSPVAGRREGLPDGDTSIPGGQMNLALGPFVYQLGGVGPSSDGGITVPETGIYQVGAGLRLGSDVSDEMQLRIYSSSVGTLSIQSVEGVRHMNTSAMALLTAGSSVDLRVYNNGSTNSADDFFSTLPYLAVYLLHRID